MGGDNPLLSGSSALAPSEGVATRRKRCRQSPPVPAPACPRAGAARLATAAPSKKLSSPRSLTSLWGLSRPLARLEDRGAVRVAAVAGGKRVISKL